MAIAKFTIKRIGQRSILKSETKVARRYEVVTRAS